ncbi:hypothetical protein SMMN14_07515 [Sphaerulina musiva]
MLTAFIRALAATSLLLTATVTADFLIYHDEYITPPDNGGNQGTENAIMIYDGPPSCDDVNNNYALLSEAADESSSGYYRCEGCGDYGDIVNWDITELELNGQNGWGHYTIYEDAGYQITPADGSALRGSCVVARDATYDCTSALTNDHGQLLFRCTSDLTGLHAR